MIGRGWSRGLVPEGRYSKRVVYMQLELVNVLKGEIKELDAHCQSTKLRR